MAASGLMDTVYRNELYLIAWLQARFHDHSDFFRIVSQVFAPSYIFVFLAPIFHSFDRSIGRRILLTVIVSEWISQLIKWSLHGERPYWLAHEISLPKDTVIRQFPTTCENAPGTPSAHVLCTTSVWYVITKYFLENIQSRNKKMLHLLLWSAYVTIVVAVIMSRVYLASHFVHQCLLGLTVGCITTVAMNRLQVNKMKIKHFVQLSIVLFTVSVFVFLTSKAIGRDPTWSIHKAIKACAKDHPSLHTPPFDSVVRYCGFALGMGLGFNSALYTKAFYVKFTTVMKISCATLSIGTIKMCEFIVHSMFDAYQSYVTTFLLNVLLPYLFIAVVPFIVSKVYYTAKHKFS